MSESGSRTISISLMSWAKLALVAISTYLLFRTVGILLVVLTAITISTAIEPVIRWARHKGVPRLLSVITVYAGAALFLSVFFYFLFLPLVDEISGSGKDLVAGANEVVRRLNALLNDKNQAQLVKTLANLDTATRGIADVARKLDPVLRDVPGMTREARQALARADALLVNMNQLTVELTQRVDTLEKVGKSAE